MRDVAIDANDLRDLAASHYNLGIFTFEKA